MPKKQRKPKLTPDDAAKKAFYEQQVAPLLREAGNRARGMGIQMLAVSEYSAEERHYTYFITRDATDAMQMMFAAMKANGSIDKLAIDLGRLIVGNNLPHSSVVLDCMGIKPNPMHREGVNIPAFDGDGKKQ